MAYTYRGNIHDAHLAIVTDETDAEARNPRFREEKCGTKAGYRQHQRYYVPLCAKCREAQAEYMRNYNRAKRAA